MKNLPDKQYLVSKVGKKKDLPKLKRTSAEIISLYADDGVDFGGGGTSDFNELDNRPKYNGKPMTGETDVVSGGGAISGHGVPTKDTEGTLGQTYIDLDTNKYYVLDKIDSGVYYWSNVDTESVVDTKKYAELQYYSVFSVEYSVQWAENCEVSVVDVEKYEAWCSEHPNHWGDEYNFDYQSAGNYWQYNGGMGEPVVIPAEDMESTTGISATVTAGSEWAYFAVRKTVNVDKDSEIKTVDIIGQKQLDALGVEEKLGDIIGIGPDEITINKQAVYSCWLDGNTITTIPNNFLRECNNLIRVGNIDDKTGQILYLGNVTKIGDYFLSNCASLESSSSFVFRIDFGDTLCVVGDNFFSNVSSFNVSQIFIDGSVEFGDSCLSNIPSTGELILYSVKGLGSAFCLSSQFSTIRINASDWVTIPDNFCSSCSNLTSFAGVNYGSTVDFGSVKSIGFNFLSNCSKFNSDLIFPSVTTISHHFLSGDSVFNSALRLPSCVSIGMHFLASCKSYSKTLSLPVCVSVGDYFLYNTDMYPYSTSPFRVELPNLGSITPYFMRFGNVTELFVDNSQIDFSKVSSQKNYVMSTNSVSGQMYAGITITGKGAKPIKDYFPNVSSGQYLRKINLGPNEGSVINTGTSAPTVDTYGEVGTLCSCVISGTGHIYICTNVSTGQTPVQYTWTQLI